MISKEANDTSSLVSEVDRAEIGHMQALWTGLYLLPLSMGASAARQKLKSHISSVTGLSPAHVSTQGLKVKRSGKIDRLRKRQEANAIRTLTESGLTASDARDLLDGLPSTPLAGFVATISGSTKIQLPLASAFAAMLDESCVAAGSCLDASDLDSYKDHLSEAAERLRKAVGLGDDSGHQRTLKMEEAISSSRDWTALKDVTKALIEDMCIALICAIDVEWTAHYLPGVKASPTFHWLFPRVHPDMDPTNSKRLKRNVIVHPTRKLLEFCWAIASHSCSRRQGWPKKPPRPKDIARDSGLEPNEDGRIRKLMSGSAHASVDEIIRYWDGMFEHLDAKAPRGEVLAPVPWIILALWMERTFIQNDKSDMSTTVFVQSGESYAALWDRMRSLWNERLPRPGNDSWPAWMTVQPSRPDWAPSFQSSGLSSSPRDCQ